MLGLVATLVVFGLLIVSIGVVEFKAAKRSRHAREVRKRIPEMANIAARRARQRFGTDSPETRAIMDSIDHLDPGKYEK